MLSEFLTIALKNITHRKLRSLLTMLGIVIGVAAIIAIITISQGLERSITEQVEKFGANRISVFPKTPGDPTASGEYLNENDRDKMQQIAEYEYVAAWLTKSFIIEFNDEKKSQNVLGFDTKYTKELERDYDLEFTQGRNLRDEDSFSAIIGPKAATDMFEKEVRLRNTILINNQKFKIVGIIKSFGNPDDDFRVYIPLKTMRSMTGKSDDISFIDAKVKPTYDLDAVVVKTQKVLEKIRDEEEFEVSTFEQLAAQIGSILSIVQTVLIGIAGISIVVGGIGIMNSMYTSVIERTKEIGIMKAVGATRKHIILFFMLEAGILGGIGGGIGALVGSLIAKGVGIFATTGGFGFLEIHITAGIILFGILFAIVIGMISGALPARQAALLQPVDALRK